MSRLDDLEALLAKAERTRNIGVCLQADQELGRAADALIAIARAAADIIAYEKAPGDPAYLHWEEKYQAMADALDRLESDQ